MPRDCKSLCLEHEAGNVLVLRNQAARKYNEKHAEFTSIIVKYRVANNSRRDEGVYREYATEAQRRMRRDYKHSCKNAELRVVQGAVRAHTESMQPNRNAEIRRKYVFFN